jgi:hypothetical protein
MTLATEGIRNYIGFAGVVVYFKILNEFQPPTLMHVQISLSKDILKTFVIGVDVATGSH